MYACSCFSYGRRWKIGRGDFFRRMYSPPSWGLKNSEENAFGRGECLLLNCHKRKTYFIKVFYILIWVNSMVCIQSGHSSSWKALSFLSVRVMPWTSTVICWVDGFAMECTRRLWDLLWDFLVPDVLKTFPCCITKLTDTEIPLESRDQEGNKLGQKELWDGNWEASKTELCRHCMHGVVGKNGNPSRKFVGRAES